MALAHRVAAAYPISTAWRARAAITAGLIACGALSVTGAVSTFVTLPVTAGLMVAAWWLSLRVAHTFEPFVVPLRAAAAVMGPDAASILARRALDAMARGMSTSTVRRTPAAAFTAALAVQVSAAVGAPCLAGHHPGCAHRRRPATIPEGTPPVLVAALISGATPKSVAGAIPTA